MTDSPDQPNAAANDPQQPLIPDASEPAPTSVAPGGLAPSPGIAPPAGMHAPELSQPEFTAPQPTSQEPSALQFPEQPEYAQPEYAQPAATQLPEQQPAAPQYGQPQFEQQPYPQDPAQQPYPQDPAAAQYAPAPGGPGAPMGPGGPAGPAGPGGPGGPTGPKKGLSTGAIVGIVGGAVALVVLLVVGGIFAVSAMFSSTPSASGTGSSGSSDGEAVKSAKTPDGTIEQFLTAVAEGDANTARKLAGGSTSDDLLTEEALAASLELAPITNIVVDPDVLQANDYEATVSASFDVGDTTVKRDFKLWNTSKTWEISDGLVSLSLNSFEGLDPEVNGVDVGTGSSIKVFPGAYQVTLGLDRFELDSKTDIFVIGDRNDTEVFYSLSPKLTEAATEEYRTLVAEAVKQCLTSKTFTTECGLEVSKELSGGEKVIDGTIVRKLDTEGEAKLKRLKPETSFSEPTIVSTYEYITITTTAEVDKDGERGTGELLGGGRMLTPKVDFAEDEPTVSWE